MPILNPEYDFATLTRLCKTRGLTEPDIKRLFSYYLYVTTRVAIYHSNLLNLSLSSFFSPPRGMGRFFDLQELEHRFTNALLHPEKVDTRPINIKICLEWVRKADCPLPENSFNQVQTEVCYFANQANRLLGDITLQDYPSLGTRLTQLHLYATRAHDAIALMLSSETLQIRKPLISHLLDELNSCCDTSEHFFAQLIRLAKLRLTPEATTAVNKTLSLLPKQHHAQFFTELMRIADRGITDLAELKLAVTEYCAHVQGENGWEDISLKQPLKPLTTLLNLAKPQYLNNGRWAYQHNRRYLQFCDREDATVPHLVKLIALETGRFGRLHADSFFCLLLQIAQQQHSLSLFTECLPMSEINPEQLVSTSQHTRLPLWPCRSAETEGQRSRERLLQLVKQAAQNTSLP